MIEYEEMSNIPATYKNRIGQIIPAVLVYCSYEIGMTIVTKDTKTHLICLTKKEAVTESSLDAYYKIFDYLYNKIKLNEEILESDIIEKSTIFVSENSADLMVNYCPFNK